MISSFNNQNSRSHRDSSQFPGPEKDSGATGESVADNRPTVDTQLDHDTRLQLDIEIEQEKMKKKLERVEGTVLSMTPDNQDTLQPGAAPLTPSESPKTPTEDSEVIAERDVVGAADVPNKYGLHVRRLEVSSQRSVTSRHNGSWTDSVQLGDNGMMDGQYDGEYGLSLIFKPSFGRKPKQAPATARSGQEKRQGRHPSQGLSFGSPGVGLQMALTDRSYRTNQLSKEDNYPNSLADFFKERQKIKKTVEGSEDFSLEKGGDQVRVVDLAVRGVGRFSGLVVQGRMEGYGRLWNSNDELIYEGEFSNGKFSGIGALFEASDLNGDEKINRKNRKIVFQGLFLNGKPTGLGRLLPGEGPELFGFFRDGTLVGQPLGTPSTAIYS